MCTFQSTCCSICMPKYFTLLEILLFWTLYRKLRYLVLCFRLDLNIIISVLSAFKLILFHLSHWTTRERSWFICLLIFFIDLFEYRRFVSSAKCSIWLCLTDMWRSLMKMIILVLVRHHEQPKSVLSQNHLLMSIELSEIKMIKSSQQLDLFFHSVSICLEVFHDLLSQRLF